jgi:hypothetical protein
MTGAESVRRNSPITIFDPPAAAFERVSAGKRHIDDDKVRSEASYRLEQIRFRARAQDVDEACSLQDLLERTRPFWLEIDQQDLERHPPPNASGD